MTGVCPPKPGSAVDIRRRSTPWCVRYSLLLAFCVPRQAKDGLPAGIPRRGLTVGKHRHQFVERGIVHHSGDLTRKGLMTSGVSEALGLETNSISYQGQYKWSVEISLHIMPFSAAP